MNDSSSWNCFSWSRNRKYETESGKRSPKKHRELGDVCEQADIPDEQFVNLLGGE
jgi:hypothetical protein